MILFKIDIIYFFFKIFSKLESVELYRVFPDKISRDLLKFNHFLKISKKRDQEKVQFKVIIFPKFYIFFIKIMFKIIEKLFFPKT